MTAAETILEQWVDRMTELLPTPPCGFRSGEQDAFGNPVASLVRKNLAVLAEYLVGEGDAGRAVTSVAALVRMLALQGEPGAGGAGFLALVQPILAEVIPGQEPCFNQRLQSLTVAAGGEYRRCRDLLSALRENEKRRAVAVPAAIAKAGIRPCQ